MSKQQGSNKPAPRVGFGNFQEVQALMRRRDALAPYAAGAELAKITTAMLPADLRGHFEAFALADIVRADAKRQIAEIDRTLESLGFDTSTE